MPNKKLKVASLFSGCGGSDLGMIGGFTYLGKKYRSLNFEIVYAADFDQYAVETYNKNFSHKAVQADVTEVDFSLLPDVDVMIGGFPCQSFSTVNPTKDTNDDRANLYKQIVRFLKTKQPKYFICENVKGLLTLQGGAIIKKIVREFSGVGYNVCYRLVKAVEFGVPQRRERVIIVGIRKDINDVIFHYPKPICTEATATPLKSVIDKLRIPQEKYYFSQRAVEGMKNAKKNMKRGLWQDLEKPCLTVTSHLAKVSINSRDPLLLVDPEKELYRRFTPREAARIQSFPDDFLLHSSEAKSYKQIGNAVPPVMMWYIAKALEDSIAGKQQPEVYDLNSTMGSQYQPKELQMVLDFQNLLEQYPDTIVVNEPIRPVACRIENDRSAEISTDVPFELLGNESLDLSKNLLISLVKNDNMESFLDGSANIYYTGKKFPSTVHLNHLYYFMPYVKGKGIKDLYLIKVARVGTRKEGQPDNDPNDLRLVFEIEFIKSLFDEYKKINLPIWDTFNDTTLGKLVGCN